MARPRSNNKSPRKGGGTSFGKRSDAEKSYRKKPSSSRSDDSDSKRSSGKPSGFRKSTGSFRSSSSDKPASSRPYSARPDRGDKDGFRRSETGSGSYNKPRSDGDEKKPFRRTSSSAKPWESGKRPYQRDDSQGERPKRSSRDDSKGGYNRPDDFKRAPRKDFNENRAESSRGFNKDYQKPEGFRRADSSETPREKSGDDFKKPVRKTGDFVKKDGDFRNQRDNKSFGKEERKSFVQSRVTTADFTRPDRKAKVAAPVEEERKSDGLTRLNKYIANSGVGSRREADKLITMGLISVNGVTITELGTKVKVGDVIRYEDKILKAEKLVYILLNKPKGFITTTDDPQERSTVMGLVAGACKERIYPVGRLDRNTTGLLLLTNDGDLADKLTHPSYQAKKVYKVELDKPITKNDFQKIQEGVRLEEGRAMVDDVAIISDDNKTLGLEIHIGWNRVVRRIFETLGYVVVKLDRSVYAGLDKKDTPRGNWRFLKPEEIVKLKHFK